MLTGFNKRLKALEAMLSSGSSLIESFDEDTNYGDGDSKTYFTFDSYNPPKLVTSGRIVTITGRVSASSDNAYGRLLLPKGYEPLVVDELLTCYGWDHSLNAGDGGFRLGFIEIAVTDGVTDRGLIQWSFADGGVLDTDDYLVFSGVYTLAKAL